MELTLTTPALLFPAISLLLLAYTNRFLTLASLMRDLSARYRESRDPVFYKQLLNLRYRIIIIRNMQVCGVASFFGGVLCMIMLFAGQRVAGTWIFGASLILLLFSLALSLREVQVSIDALMLQVDDGIGMQKQCSTTLELALSLPKGRQKRSLRKSYEQLLRDMVVNNRRLLFSNAMWCPTCHEAVLPEAMICRFCGRLINQPVQHPPATDITQPLPPAAFCPQCEQLMDVGVGVTSSDGHNLWWVAGESISEERPVGFKRQIQQIYPMQPYRCPACGLISWYAQDTQGDTP